MATRFGLSMAFLSGVACSNGTQVSSGSSAAAAASTIAMFPSPASVVEGNSITLSAVGGTPPYSFVVQNSFGSVNSTGGTSTTYTAPSALGTAAILITDSAYVSAIFQVSVTSSSGATTAPSVTNPKSPLQIAASAATVVLNGTLNFSATGGTGGYVFSVVSGGGGFNGASYIAPGSAMTVTVQVADSSGAISQATISVFDPSNALCAGVYDIYVNGVEGTMYITQNGGNALNGELILGPDSYYLSGSCTSNSISFTNVYNNTAYTGANSSSHGMIGQLVTASGGNYGWFATYLAPY
jgi:hypothetical protein